MATTNFQQLPAAIGLTGAEIVPILQGGVDKRTTTALISQLASASALPAAIEWTINGAGGNINSQIWGTLTVPFNATISSVTMEADQVGSITMDIWKCTYAQYNPPTTPTSANSITGGAPPAITAASKSQPSIATWNTTLTLGDILTFYVPTTSTAITRVTLSLNLLRVVS